ATAPHYRGPYKAVSDTPLYDARDFELEDPFIWRDASGQYCMIAKDMDGRSCGEAGGGIFATSSDCLDWEIHHGQLAYSKNVLWEDGVTRRMGSLERPFILFEEGEPTHMFFATSDGPGGLMACENTWNMVIPLKRNKPRT
ncbi:MAG: glycosyl hydrolase family 43, partial [Cellulosilyticaceae bacterium]